MCQRVRKKIVENSTRKGGGGKGGTHYLKLSLTGSYFFPSSLHVAVFWICGQTSVDNTPSACRVSGLPLLLALPPQGAS